MAIIILHDGSAYDLEDYGIRTRDILISAPVPDNELKKIEGADGVVDYGTSLGAREITCLFTSTAYDFVDFPLHRNEIFNIIKTKGSFYLIEKRASGKRWLVKVANAYLLEQVSVYGKFEVELTGIKGVSESIGTTQDIERDGIDSGSGIWGFGMGLIADEDALKYTHDLPRFSRMDFRIYNAGDVPIHPFEQDLKITISNVKGSTDYLELVNKTNGSTFRVNEKVTSGQTIVLDGPNIKINSLNALRKTNRKYIELEPGWNDFTVRGATSARVEFDFRFYYF